MQVTTNFGYDQIFELARRLSPEEQERLAQSLHASNPRLPGTVLSEDEIEKKRQELIRLALECPVASEEEICEIEKNMKNFRKEFNESFERRLD